MKIFLIGYMSSGKSKYGKKIAKALSLSFYDLDKMIEEYYGSSVSDIFSKEGEEGFRVIEQKVLHSCREINNAIIALGGGTPCFYNNMDFVNSIGCSVYLKANSSFLSSRLFYSNKDRPLIKGKSREEIEEFVAKHLKEREIYYDKAQISIDAISFDLNNAVVRLKTALMEAGG